MEREKISTFIEKVFEKTHSEQLYWSVIDKKDNLYKPTSIEENCPFYSSNDFHELDNRYSYFSKYKNGCILLLTYRDNKNIPCPIPPDKCKFSLRMQDDSSRFSTEITNSSITDDHIQLTRLFNLVEEKSNQVKFLINDFLNS